MKTKTKVTLKAAKVAGLTVLLASFSTCPLRAEETAITTPAETTLSQTASTASQSAGNITRREWRKQRAEKFLEGHPEIKQRLDANGDGTVDKEEFKKGRQEKREEKREKFLENHPKLQEKMDGNGDGTVDKTEFKQGREKFQERREQRKEYRREHKDYDNNPPGPRGGSGTNWENRPGPQGGSGASPDRQDGNGGGRGFRSHRGR